MSTTVRREIPMLMISVLGIIWIVDLIFVIPPLSVATTYFYRWATLIGVFTVFLGAINMVRRNIAQVRNLPVNDPNKYLNLWGLILYFTLVILGIGSPVQYRWLSLVAYGNLDLIMGSMLGLWLMVSASRALRIRGFESGLFLVAAFLVLMKTVPIGEAIHPLLSAGGQFILDSWAKGMTRSMILGIGFGTMASMIRAMAGLERRFMGVE